jgi:hypothetical protein
MAGAKDKLPLRWDALTMAKGVDMVNLQQGQYLATCHISDILGTLHKQFVPPYILL